MQKIYQQIAFNAQAYHCVKPAFKTKHMLKIYKLIESLPHGSGIDGETKIDINLSNNKRIVLRSSFHVINNGLYKRWIDFSVIIKADLVDSFDLSIRGNFGRDQGIKEYLYELFASGIR